MANAESAPTKSGASPTTAPPKGTESQDVPMPKQTPGPRPKWRHYIEAAIAFVIMALLARLSMVNAADVGARLARLIAPWTSSWQTAKKNLALAMPELGMFERRRIAAQSFDNFGRVMAEYCKLPWMWRTSWDSIVDVVGREHLQRAAGGSKRGVIIFTAHLGNWEIIPMVLAHAGRPVMLVYRAANNPLIDKRVSEIRGLYTAALAPKGTEGARAIVDHIQNGGVVYMVVDQKMNTGVEVPLFGVGAMTGKAIARIAMRHHCELLPARCERLGRSQFRVTFEAPWFVPGDHRNENDVRDALAKINLKIEEWVRATPGQWLWMHRRWPKAAKRPS